MQYVLYVLRRIVFLAYPVLYVPQGRTGGAVFLADLVSRAQAILATSAEYPSELQTYHSALACFHYLPPPKPLCETGLLALALNSLLTGNNASIITLSTTLIILSHCCMMYLYFFRRM